MEPAGEHAVVLVIMLLCMAKIFAWQIRKAKGAACEWDGARVRRRACAQQAEHTR